MTTTLAPASLFSPPYSEWSRKISSFIKMHSLLSNNHGSVMRERKIFFINPNEVDKNFCPRQPALSPILSLRTGLSQSGVTGRTAWVPIFCRQGGPLRERNKNFNFAITQGKTEFIQYTCSAPLPQLVEIFLERNIPGTLSSKQNQDI